ncbi:biopolymer transporter ExbD [Flagellatimonas centrodinii]|uniref:ExbD/TolR family protein n=1 Tax=Flagellatimonas centrodinii TaxID=2806210 RepID=UPI001FF0561B|nr:biopolymer transporter ExbD [Flagellatimonas centrodinii]ULQ46737.1 biopolymer transporter ExbD [Flagellatimonas centrodinii]
MSLSLGSCADDDEVISVINTTPLVDVMLVLLIIFLITIPVVTDTVPVALPEERNVPTETTPQNIVVAVDRDGAVYWNDRKVANAAALLTLLKRAAVQVPQPEIHIRGDMNVRYYAVGNVVVACQRAGIRKVGFLTEPPQRT